MCSRLSTAGSIAAAGSASPVAEGCPAVCSRLSTAGSIAAALLGGRFPRWPVRVLPPFNGGLHCGEIHSRRTSPRSPAARAPAFQRRAPLRPSGLPIASPFRPACSRLSTAGSIAAPGHWLIAQYGPLSARAPAFQRRAPLRRSRSRRRADRSQRVLPPFNGGLHCGARDHRRPAGAGSWCSRLSTAGSIAAPVPQRHELAHRPVLPPFNGGLHCGGDDDVARRDGGRPGAPAFQRRAPLRPRACSAASRTTRSGAPAFQRRAPLRPDRVASAACDADRRAPAVQRRAPLRRAWSRRGMSGVRPGCSRLLNGGLHCGRIAGRGWSLASRLYQPRCSRLSTAGSIAAARCRS